jgi:hypothetical protein
VGTYNPGSVLSFTQPNGFWTPIAVRAFTHGEDWDIAAYTSGTGGPIGTCANGILSSSNYVSGYTDFVIGNFNYDPVGTYYVNTTRYVGTGGAEVQYFSGSQTIALGDPHVVRTANSSFLVESWDTHLVSGQQYSIFFSHDPGLDVKVDLFAATGGVYWTGRSTALLEATHSTTFTAPVTGWYGLVVVNDGGTGLFNVGIATGVTAVDDAVRPDRDALNGVSPNPGRTGLHFDYALHEAGPVAFEVIDMAGRLVSRFEPASTSAGKWSAAWPGTGSSGQPLHPGVYFVRMRVGDRLVGTRKLTLLQ